MYDKASFWCPFIDNHIPLEYMWPNYCHVGIRHVYIHTHPSFNVLDPQHQMRSWTLDFSWAGTRNGIVSYDHKWFARYFPLHQSPHHIVQNHNKFMLLDWHYSTKYFSHSNWMWELFRRVLSVQQQNISMVLNNSYQYSISKEWNCFTESWCPLQVSQYSTFAWIPTSYRMRTCWQEVRSKFVSIVYSNIKKKNSSVEES